jgi:hypothetical protein
MKKYSNTLLMTFALTATISCSVYPPDATARKQVISEPENRLLVLKNDHVVLGLIPEAGAHIVLFRSHDSSNVLDSNPVKWLEPVPIFSAEEPTFAPYDGHITWLGPQKDWWTQQDINIDRKKRRVPWPPDPFLTLGKYEILDKNEYSVKLISPKSPVTGIQMLKEISIMKNTAYLKVTAINIRDTPISWDIWSNTRIRKNADIYVPIDPGGRSFRIENDSMHPESNYVLPFKVESNYFHFDIGAAQKDNARNYTAKVFMNPPIGVIAAFCGEYLFIKRSETVPPARIHPDHAFVEIYKSISPNPSESLSEIEMHGEYRVLKPGESMSFEEKWQLIPYKKPISAEDKFIFLKSAVE